MTSHGAAPQGSGAKRCAATITLRRPRLGVAAESHLHSPAHEERDVEIRISHLHGRPLRVSRSRPHGRRLRLGQHSGRRRALLPRGDLRPLSLYSRRQALLAPRSSRAGPVGRHHRDGDGDQAHSLPSLGAPVGHPPAAARGQGALLGGGDLQRPRRTRRRARLDARGVQVARPGQEDARRPPERSHSDHPPPLGRRHGGVPRQVL